MNRSYLFVPGDSRHKLEKAAQSAADAVVIDWEDAVAPTQKEMARQVTAVALDEVDFGQKQLFVRLNGVDSEPFGDDLAALREMTAVGLVIPKLEQPDHLNKLTDLKHPIIGLIESALGLFNLRPLLTTGVPLAGLMFGGEDYVASIGGVATAERTELLYGRSAIVAAAAALGIPAIDTVFLAFNDDAGLRHDCTMARRLGFDGKIVIHPRQIPVVNGVWGDGKMTAVDQKLLDAYEAHLASGKGVFAYDGKMVDEAVVRQLRGREGGGIE